MVFSTRKPIYLYPSLDSSASAAAQVITQAVDPDSLLKHGNFESVARKSITNSGTSKASFVHEERRHCLESALQDKEIKSHGRQATQRVL